jgi:hypothetical protein
MIVRAALPAALAFTLALAACRKEEVTAYRVPKEKTAESGAAMPAQMPGMAGAAVAPATGADLVWTAPAHWKSKPASAMRRATLTIPGESGADGDLSITSLSGEAGGELANFNRWRSQLQLPPIGQAELATAVSRREHNGLKFAVVDIAAPSGGQRVLGAWAPFAGNTWFFKLTGPDALLTKEKAAFDAFVASVKPAPASGTP